jgi:hypothetical protein
VIPIVVPIFVVMVVVMVFVSTVVIVVVMEIVPMLAIPCTGPFELVCPRLFLLAMTLGFRAAAVVRVIFSRPYEVDRSVTRLVLVTVVPPVSSVFGRNVQIKRCDVDLRGGWLDDHRTCVDNGRRRGAGSQIYAAVYTGGDFSPYCDSDIQVTGMRDRRQRSIGQGKQDGGTQSVLHRGISQARLEQMARPSIRAAARYRQEASLRRDASHTNNSQ